MDTSPIKTPPEPSQPPESTPVGLGQRGKNLPIGRRWGLIGFSVGIALLITGLAGMMAVRHMLQIAELPDCRADLSSDHSLSARLYCADEIAKNRTMKNLRDAIKLVSSIPENDPLRATGDRRIDQWSQDLLEIGESAYQAGDLDAAIRAAHVVPISSRVYPTATERLDQWKDRWEKAERIYKDTQDAIDREEWRAALNTAREFLKLDNHYWQTTRYQELLDQVQAGKEQQKNEKVAAKKREKAAQTSTKWDRNFDAEAITRLKRANELAQSGSLKGLRAAITEAQQIYYATSSYDKAQNQIEQWQQQAERIEDRQHLDQAIRLANRGGENSLQAAIDEAFMVSPMGGLYEEARGHIDRWTDQLYRIKYPMPAKQVSGKRMNTAPQADSYPIPSQSQPSVAAPGFPEPVTPNRDRR